MPAHKKECNIVNGEEVALKGKGTVHMHRKEDRGKAFKSPNYPFHMAFACTETNSTTKGAILHRNQ